MLTMASIVASSNMIFVSYFSGRYSVVLRGFLYPLTCRCRKKSKCKKIRNIFTKVLQTSVFTCKNFAPSHVASEKGRFVKETEIFHRSFTNPAFFDLFTCSRLKQSKC